MTKKMLLMLAAAAVAGLAAASVAVAHDPPGQGKKDDNATTAAATTSASSASKPKPKNFIAKLRGANEVPAVTTDGLGIAKLRVNGGKLHWFVNASNLDNVTAAHVHCGAAGVNGPVVLTLFPTATFTAPTNPAGRFTSGWILLTDDIADVDCGFTVDEDNVVDHADDIVALLRLTPSKAYVNVHSSDFPGGEIRGQVRKLGPKS